MRELKRVEIMSAAKVTAVVSAIWGFIAAVISLPFLAIASSASALAGQAGAFNVAPLLFGLGVASIVVAPIMAAIMGFICGAIGAFFYNVAAKYVGGVKLDL